MRLPRCPLLLLAALWAAASIPGYGQGSKPPAGKPSPSAVSKAAPGGAVAARCTLRSDVSIEIRCEVASTIPAGTPIIEAVPEGTQVKQGDVLVKFDASALEDQLLSQEIALRMTHAAVVKAESQLELAGLAREEYERGKYALEEQTALIEIVASEEKCRETQDRLSRLKELLDSAGGNEGAKQRLSHEREVLERACRRAGDELALARAKLAALRQYTKPKMLRQFEGAIASARAELEAAKAQQALGAARLERIKGRIEKCVIRAPAPG